MVGESEDWAAWLDRHGPALVLFARQWTASRDDAEDVVQDAFIRFWRSRLRAVDPVAFLYTCVRRCALDWRRTQGRRSRREQFAARPEADSYFIGSEGRSELREAIEDFLRGLPDNQREVLVMKVWGGLSFPQIADALGISTNTASSRYRYALDKLRTRSAEELIP